MQHGQSSTLTALPVPATCKHMNILNASSFPLSFLRSRAGKSERPILPSKNQIQRSAMCGHKNVAFVIVMDTIAKGAPPRISTLFATTTEMVPGAKCKGRPLPPCCVIPLLHAVFALSSLSRRITGTNTTPIEVGLDIPEPQRGATIVVSDSE